MADHKDEHPDLNELLIGVVDERDLPPAVRRHFQECPSCRAEKEQFEAGLAQIGRLANKHVPQPARPISLPEKRSITYFRALPVWKTAFTGISLAVLVVGLLFGSYSSKSPSPPDISALLAEMQEDERFRGEIAAFGQNILPGLYRDLTDEPDSSFDESFMEYVVPVPGGEEVSGENRKGGGVC